MFGKIIIRQSFAGVSITNSAIIQNSPDLSRDIYKNMPAIGRPYTRDSFLKPFMHAYTSDTSAHEYIQFLDSPNGQMFRRFIFEAISARLDVHNNAKILDAACGTGWLGHELAGKGFSVKGCDAAGPLIEYGKNIYKNIELTTHDLTSPLPYAHDEFDAIVMSMALHDVPDQMSVLANVSRVLKPGGKLVATIVNPYYGWPVGAWKRGILGFFLRQKPKLKLWNFYNRLASADAKDFSWRKNLTSSFHTLPKHINNLICSGFTITYLQDLSSPTDNKQFNLEYQLYRFPIILLVEAKKSI